LVDLRLMTRSTQERLYLYSLYAFEMWLLAVEYDNDVNQQ